MKANEVPEKIILSADSETGELDDRWFIRDFTNNIKIEYTRTDAFIEKAEKFLEDNLTEKDCKFNWGEWTKVKSGDTPIASFMREFRNYMKGE